MLDEKEPVNDCEQEDKDNERLQIKWSKGNMQGK